MQGVCLTEGGQSQRDRDRGEGLAKLLVGPVLRKAPLFSVGFHYCSICSLRKSTVSLCTYALKTCVMFTILFTETKNGTNVR